MGVDIGELREPQNARPPGTFMVNVPRRFVLIVAHKGNDPEELKVNALEASLVLLCSSHRGTIYIFYVLIYVKRTNTHEEGSLKNLPAANILF